jgi:hypothetical protein
VAASALSCSGGSSSWQTSGSFKSSDRGIRALRDWAEIAFDLQCVEETQRATRQLPPRPSAKAEYALASQPLRVAAHEWADP